MREWEFAVDEDSGGSEARDVAEQAQDASARGTAVSPVGRVQQNEAWSACAKRASRRASGGWVMVNPCATRGMDGALRGPCSVRGPRQDSEWPEQKGWSQRWGIALKRRRPASVATLCCCFEYGCKGWSCALATQFRRRPKGRE
jgi:hypothetical protein